MPEHVALVTGASRGIGRSIAKALAQQGQSVLVGYHRRQEDARETVRQIQALGGQAAEVSLSIARQEHMVRAWLDMMHGHGPVTILVNNAGIAQEKPFSELTDEDWHEMLSVNLLGAVHCCTLAIPAMQQHQWGRIVNITSIGGQIGGINQVHYAAAKAGLISLTKSLARLYARDGITVNAVAPGIVPTDMTRHELSTPEGSAKVQHTPLGRCATPEEVAAAVVFLCSQEASSITGQTLNVNGGAYCG